MEFIAYSMALCHVKNKYAITLTEAVQGVGGCPAGAATTSSNAGGLRAHRRLRPFTSFVIQTPARFAAHGAFRRIRTEPGPITLNAACISCPYSRNAWATTAAFVVAWRPSSRTSTTP